MFATSVSSLTSPIRHKKKISSQHQQQQQQQRVVRRKDMNYVSQCCFVGGCMRFPLPLKESTRKNFLITLK